MKVKELQIGDWISSPYGNIQVEFIYNNGYDDVVGEHEEMYLDWDTGEEDPRMKDITIEMVEPIPLTEEILLKNGFILDEEWAEYYNEELNKKFCLEYNFRKEFFIVIATYSKFLYIKYVHELQHLLRLYGLSVLADNFKIE